MTDNTPTISEYQQWTNETAVEHATSDTDGVDKTDSVVFLSLALNGETGEVAEKAKRVVRGDGELEDIANEIGDVLWYLARIADELGVDMVDIMAENMDKLETRKATGTIKGSGDTREQDVILAPKTLGSEDNPWDRDAIKAFKEEFDGVAIDDMEEVIEEMEPGAFNDGPTLSELTTDNE